MIENGYLAVQTHPDHPGFILLKSSDQFNATEGQQQTGVKTWYVAHFNDIEAASMHALNHMKRRYVESWLFRTTVADAIAAVDSVGLQHKTIFCSPDLTESEIAEIEAIKDRRLQVDNRWNHLANLVGKLAILFLILQMLTPLLRLILE